jgi:putative redox protein
MVKMHAQYLGEKHCEIIHEPSHSKIGTDAPKDNNGRGALFSPTDLVGAALGSCMLTVMAITAEKDGVDIKGARVNVEKEMTGAPRKIAKLNVVLHMPQSVPHDYRKKIEDVALNCPVKLSLSPDLLLPVLFHYDL